MHTLTDIHHQFAEAFPEPRIKALAYLLSRKLFEGNICISRKELTDSNNGLPDFLTDSSALDTLPPYLKEAPSTDAPFIRDGDRFYFQRYYKYETNILKKLEILMKRSVQQKAARMEVLEKHRKVILSLAANYELDGLSEEKKVDWQLIAALQAQLHDFFIITGGPGTGKTTTLAKLLRILLAVNPDMRIALAAPTGKASMRMAESLRNSTEKFPQLFTPEIVNKIHELPASTLHKLLGYKRESIYFKHNQEKTLPYDIIIVDEASMVDVPMFSKLLDAQAAGTRLILLGDKDQLASVEAGSLLGDLCSTAAPLNEYALDTAEWINGFITDSERRVPLPDATSTTSLLAGHIVELKLSHRFNAQGSIGNISGAVIRSDIGAIRDLMQQADEKLIFDTTYDPRILKEFVDGYAVYCRETDIKKALAAFNELRVLTTIREGERGLYAMNKKIQQLLADKGLIQTEKVFYEHRPVIITRNNYELDLFNGDVGIVRADSQGQLRVWFESDGGNIRSVFPAYLSDCETVFAMTIHKSQGSEFNSVMVVLPEGKDNLLLTRELLYTGITRAKKNVVICGTTETVEHTAGASVKRISGIADRIQSITV